MLTKNERKDILNSVLEIIKSISDLEYQRRVWICGEIPGTDFDETVNNYSLDAEGILDHYKDFEITEIEFQVLKKFDNQFRDFYRKNNWPHKFINTSEWTNIMALAKETLKTFNHPDNSK